MVRKYYRRELSAEELKNRDELISSNLNFVKSIAKKYLDKGLPLNDLIQEGNLGIIKAAERYNEKKGKFSTYAAPWIQNSIVRALSENHFIKLSNAQTEKFNKIRKYLNGGYSLEKVASIFRIPSFEIENTLFRQESPVSLDSHLEQEDRRDVETGVILEEKYCPEKELICSTIKEEIPSFLEKDLDDLKSQVVIKLRMGFFDGKEYTLKEIGEIYGFYPEKVRQLEIRVLKKLRKNLLKV